MTETRSAYVSTTDEAIDAESPITQSTTFSWRDQWYAALTDDGTNIPGNNPPADARLLAPVRMKTAAGEAADQVCVTDGAGGFVLSPFSVVANSTIRDNRAPLNPLTAIPAQANPSGLTLVDARFINLFEGAVDKQKQQSRISWRSRMVSNFRSDGEVGVWNVGEPWSTAFGSGDAVMLSCLITESDGSTPIRGGWETGSWGHDVPLVAAPIIDQSWTNTYPGIAKLGAGMARITDTNIPEPTVPRRSTAATMRFNGDESRVEWVFTGSFDGNATEFFDAEVFLPFAAPWVPADAKLRLEWFGYDTGGGGSSASMEDILCQWVI